MSSLLVSWWLEIISGLANSSLIQKPRSHRFTTIADKTWKAVWLVENELENTLKSVIVIFSVMFWFVENYTNPYLSMLKAFIWSSVWLLPFKAASPLILLVVLRLSFSRVISTRPLVLICSPTDAKICQIKVLPSYLSLYSWSIWMPKADTLKRNSVWLRTTASKVSKERPQFGYCLYCDSGKVS